MEIVKSAFVVELIIAFLLVETLVIATWAARQRGSRPGVVLAAANGAAGVALLAAVHVALTDGATTWFAVALVAALVAHGVDLAMRHRLVGRG